MGIMIITTLIGALDGQYII